MMYYRRPVAPIVWGVVIAVALAVALGFAFSRAVGSAYQKGRASAFGAVRFDSAFRANIAQRQGIAVAKTDTAFQQATTQAVRVRRVVVRVPDTIRVAVPVVDTLIVESLELAATVDSLSGALADERTATAARFAVDSVAVEAARFETLAARDTIATLTKRPRWRTVLKAGAVGAVAGAACAKLCVPVGRALFRGR